MGVHICGDEGLIVCLFQPKCIDKFVIFPEILVISKVEYDFIDVVCISRSSTFLVDGRT